MHVLFHMWNVNKTERGDKREGKEREREHEGRKEIVREEEGHWGKERKTKENNCGM